MPKAPFKGQSNKDISIYNWGNMYVSRQTLATDDKFSENCIWNIFHYMRMNGGKLWYLPSESNDCKVGFALQIWYSKVFLMITCSICFCLFVCLIFYLMYVVCKFDEVGKRFIFAFRHILRVTIEIYYHLSISYCFIFISTTTITFKKY